MEVRFPCREYAVVWAPQRHSYDRNCGRENDLGQLLTGILRCVQYSMYMTSVFAKECVFAKEYVFAKECVLIMRSDRPEKGTQLRLDTVCSGPRGGLLPHNTSHRHTVWSIVLLTPTSVPYPNIPRWGYSITKHLSPLSVHRISPRLYVAGDLAKMSS